HHHKPTSNGRCYAVGGGTGLTGRTVFMRCLAGTAGGERLVDGDGDAGDLPSIHTLKSDEIAALVGNGDAHRHTNRSSLVSGALQKLSCISDIEARQCHHRISPSQSYAA